MQNNQYNQSPNKIENMRLWFGRLGFFFYIIILGIIIYFDDIQLTAHTSEEVATIYNIRILGIKIIDGLSIFLIFLMLVYLFLLNKFAVTSFHRYMGTIFLIYCYAGLIGFIYFFFYDYDLNIWVQDFQHTIYMVGFFLITFYFLDSKKRWKIFVLAFIIFLAAKNLLIFYNTLTGVGKSFTTWAFRASENSEFTYFPMMFFPLIIYFLKNKNITLKIISVFIILIYLFNSLVGIYRTVWVMLILGILFLLTQLDKSARKKLIILGLSSLLIVLFVINLFFPKFIELVWNYKFTSIFEWSVYGDRSNATRILEVINVTNYVFSNFSFLQGMGLGAWWDDSARRLLPDLGSGFTYKTKFHTTHMWYLTQFLKLGIVAMFFYWRAIYKMFKNVAIFLKTMSWDRWEKSMLLGLNIGLLCAFISSADFVRLFLIIGINFGIISSFIHHDSQTNNLSESY